MPGGAQGGRGTWAGPLCCGCLWLVATGGAGMDNGCGRSCTPLAPVRAFPELLLLSRPALLSDASESGHSSSSTDGPGQPPPRPPGYPVGLAPQSPGGPLKAQIAPCHSLAVPALGIKVGLLGSLPNRTPLHHPLGHPASSLCCPPPSAYAQGLCTGSVTFFCSMLAPQGTHLSWPPGHRNCLQHVCLSTAGCFSVPFVTI